MRYKIKTSSEKAYRDVCDRLRAKNIEIFVASEKRGIISTGNIPATVLSDIKHRGARVSADYQYTLETRKHA